MKIMTNYQLIDRMKELLNEPNYYGSGGSNWSTWVNGGWYVDCTCSIKAILWGGRFIPANRTKKHAGCKYGSNGVPDFTPSSCVTWTKDTKGHFDKLVPGEILLMTTHGHAGLYIGNGQVIEVTPAWTGGKPGCQISQIGKNGERIKNGRQVYSWEYHGKIPVVDYVNPTPEPEPKPEPKPTPSKLKYNIGDKVIINGQLYGNADGGNPGQIVYNRITYITRRAEGHLYPYNTTGDLGWMAEAAISPYKEDDFKIGNKVKIKSKGRASSYGDLPEAGGIGWSREIIGIYEGRAYPYQVGNSSGTTGFYKKEALEKIG
jgi:hypothetical protein